MCFGILLGSTLDTEIAKMSGWSELVWRFIFLVICYISKLIIALWHLIQVLPLIKYLTDTVGFDTYNQISMVHMYCVILCCGWGCGTYIAKFKSPLRNKEINRLGWCLVSAYIYIYIIIYKTILSFSASIYICIYIFIYLYIYLYRTTFCNILCRLCNKIPMYATEILQC